MSRPFKADPFNIYHSPEDDNGGGQVSLETPPESALGQGAEDITLSDEPTYFHSYTHDDGEVHNFESADDLNSFLRENYLRRSDYSKKTAEIADQRRQFENDRNTFFTLKQDWESPEKTKMREMYDRWDKGLASNPRLKQALIEQFNDPDDPERLNSTVEQIITERYGDQLKQIEDYNKTQAVEKERAEVFKQLKESFPDFNEEQMIESFDMLTGPDATLKDLFTVLYHAGRGQSTDPVQVEQKIVQNQLMKKGAGLNNSTGTPPSPPNPEAEDLESAALAAINEIS